MFHMKHSCSDCGQMHDRVRRRRKKDGSVSVIKQSKCRACHAAYVRRTRKPWRALSDEERQKSNCRSYTHVLVKRGELERKPCEECSAEAEAHHPDYTDPRNVIWLCRPHHMALHAAS